MARIALVRQSRPHYEVNYTHPLGLMSLAAYLRASDGHEVTIHDNRIERRDMEEVLNATLATQPDVVGLTGLTVEAPIVYEFARRIRRRAPSVFIVAGGIHASGFGERLLEEAPFDAVVMGEGEIGLRLLVNALGNGRDFSGIEGVAYRKDGEIVRNEGRLPVPDLDELPLPAWDLIPVKKYFGQRMGDLMYSRREQMSLYTSRACPYHCVFCHNMFGRDYRARSAAKVFEEVDTLYREWGIREFHFQDDIFNLNVNRAKDVCRLIIESGHDTSLAFPNGLRADIMDDELIDLLHKAGAKRIAYAVESASPRIQKSIKKKMNMAKLAEVVEKTARKGILVKGFFMLGFPGETQEEMDATIRFARDHEFDVVNFSRVIPTKGSDLYETLRGEGAVPEYDYEHYTYDYSDINLSAVEDAAFEQTIRRAYRSFLSRPRRLLRLIRVFPNKKQLFPYYFFLMLVKILRRKAAKNAPKTAGVTATAPALSATAAGASGGAR